jgi:hypothetical protein
VTDEATERLRWHKETGQTVISITKCEEAVAAERRATVERISRQSILDAALREALQDARREIEAEISMASDPEGKDQFEKGALSAYHFALSVLPDAALAAPEAGLDVERLARALSSILNDYLDNHPLPVRPASDPQWRRLADEIAAYQQDAP